MIGNSWDEHLKIIWHSQGFKNFYHIIENEYNTKTIYPPKDHIFEALKLTPYENVKVVIIGQDPYHGEGEAHGLSFSVNDDVERPPSLKNIMKELQDDVGVVKQNNDLTSWAKEGVLLLNSLLTVEAGRPLSHTDFGWEQFTDAVIQKINEKEEPVVFILWGSYARSKKVYITNPKHYVLESAHPSPLSASRGFFGSRPFSKTNAILKKEGLKEIAW